MKFGLPPWLERTREAESAPPRALVKYDSRSIAILTDVDDLTDTEELGGWTPETLAEYRAESDARAMAIVAASMEGRLRPRPRWANSRYSPLRWRG